MKRLFLGLAIIVATLACFSCKHEKASVKKDTTSMEQKEVTEMTDISIEDNSEDAHGVPNENYRKLMLIASKLDDPNFTLEKLSQSDYSFMIDFCNMFVDSAEEADMSGASEQWLSDTEELMELYSGFCTILSSAYDGDLLDSRNSHDFEIFMRRVDSL